MTAAPHRARARYATAGDDAAATVARYGALVDRAARRLAARTAGAVSAEDLWSAGAMGLLEAARRFDPSRDVRFETFAEHRIRGAMLDELRRLDHLPRRLRAQAERVEAARTRLSRSLQRDPEADELASAVGLSLEELAALHASTARHDTAPDALAAPGAGADEQLERGELGRRVTAAVSSLPERLQLVLSLHYVEGLTYREIAHVLDVSEPRVCQLHGDAVRALRAAVPG
jgi:RNA polymerase sigma factor for flagellar operon FliA